MRLTKDESRILAESLEEFKYTLVQEYKNLRLMDRLNELQDRLEYFGKDNRRTGRTSMDEWHHMIKRFTNFKKNDNESNP